MMLKASLKGLLEVISALMGGREKSMRQGSVGEEPPIKWPEYSYLLKAPVLSSLFFDQQHSAVLFA